MAGFTFDDITVLMREIFSRNIELCKDDVSYRYRSSTDNGVTLTDMEYPVGHPLHRRTVVAIGAKSVRKDTSDDGIISDYRVIWLLLQAFHESEHLRQYYEMYSDLDASEEVKAMARSRAIEVFMFEYKHVARLSNPTELWPEYRSVVELRKFVAEKSIEDLRFGNLDLDGILCSMAKRRHGEEWPDLFDGVETAEDVESAYSAAFEASLTKKRFPIGFAKEEFSSYSRGFEHLVNDRSLLKGFQGTEDGKQEIEFLCLYAGRASPGCFSALKCIEKDYARQNLKGVVQGLANTASRCLPTGILDLLDSRTLAVGKDEIEIDV